GTDKSGSNALGNADGIYSFDGSNNTIGGTAIGARNVISGNGLHGIEFDEDHGSQVITGNFIGTDITGISPLGNSRDGIRIHSSSRNTIGGAQPEAGNIIAFNGKNGVSVIQIGFPTNANSIRRNSVFSNVGLGIDLGNDGPTANDPCDVDTGA